MFATLRVPMRVTHLQRPLATLAVTAAALVAVAPVRAVAQPITDPAGDFLSTFTGPHNGDLDVLSAQVLFNGSQFMFTSRQNGAIGTTPGALYVWGVNRGSGTSPGGAFAPDVKFDAVVVFNPAGGSFVRDLRSAVNTPLSGVTFSGNMIGGMVPLALLPSLGFAPSAYTVNLWPRTGLANDAQIADFAPDTHNFAVTTTPEPGTWALLGTGLTLLGGVAMRRRQRGS